MKYKTMNLFKALVLMVSCLATSAMEGDKKKRERNDNANYIIVRTRVGR